MSEQSHIAAPERPEIVYHYTDAGGLQGIISSSSLWATDVEFLNDAQELIYARDHLLSALRSAMDDVALRAHEEVGNIGWHSDSWHEEVINGLRAREKARNDAGTHMIVGDESGLLEALGHIINELEQTGNPSRSQPFHVYVTCFCEYGDLLSQWRGYGGAGGYAIGFHSEALVSLSKTFRLGQFDKVCYGFSQAAKLGLIPRYLRPDLTFMSDYLQTITMIKHPTFSEEEEWRLMLPKLGDTSDDIFFRVGPVGIVPYVKIPFARDAVAEVIVGPGQHPAERAKGVRQFLDSYSMIDVPVQSSTSPLRL